MDCKGCIVDPEGPFKWFALGVFVISSIAFVSDVLKKRRRERDELRMRTPQKTLRGVSTRDLHLDELEEEWKAGTSKRVRRLKK